MGMPFAEADKVAKLVPEPIQGKSPAHRRGDRAGAAAQGSSTTRTRRTASCSTSRKELEGLNRHAGMHAAGVVIGDKPLWEYVPCFRRPATTSIVTQYDKDESRRPAW